MNRLQNVHIKSRVVTEKASFCLHDNVKFTVLRAKEFILFTFYKSSDDK